MEMRWYHAGQRQARVTVTYWQVESLSQRPLQHTVLVEQAEPVPLHFAGATRHARARSPGHSFRVRTGQPGRSVALGATPVPGRPAFPAWSAHCSSTRVVRGSLQLFALLVAVACGLAGRSNPDPSPGAPPRLGAQAASAGADERLADESDDEQPDEVVQEMPASAEKSIDAVARYIEERVPRGRRRVAALHDWVADCIAYAPGGPTTAQQTFEERRGVCAGYAALLRALADAADEDLSYVTGTARSSDGRKLSEHAWNLARIRHHDEPIDVTWDAGYMVDGVFEKRFSRRWLFVSPTEFAETHVPDD